MARLALPGRSAIEANQSLTWLGGDGVHGEVAEGRHDVLTHYVGVGLQGPGLPVVGIAFEELLGEGVHRPPQRPGAAVVLHRVDEGGDEFAGLAAGLGDAHGVGVADGGVAPPPTHHAVEGEGAHPTREDSQAQAGDRVVADVVTLLAGLGGADAAGEGGFGLVGHGQRLLVLGRATGLQYRKRP